MSSGQGAFHDAPGREIKEGRAVSAPSYAPTTDLSNPDWVIRGESL